MAGLGVYEQRSVAAQPRTALSPLRPRLSSGAFDRIGGLQKFAATAMPAKIPQKADIDLVTFVTGQVPNP